LAPGERYYSAIVQKGSELIRRDYASDTWSGPTSDMVGWWIARVPDKKQSKTKLAPNQVLLDTLQSFLETPGKEPIAYLLAVLLLRKRVLISQDSVESVNEETSSSIELSSVGGDQQFIVPIAEVTPLESETIQSELLELLYTED